MPRRSCVTGQEVGDDLPIPTGEHECSSSSSGTAEESSVSLLTRWSLFLLPSHDLLTEDQLFQKVCTSRQPSLLCKHLWMAIKLLTWAQQCKKWKYSQTWAKSRACQIWPSCLWLSCLPATFSILGRHHVSALLRTAQNHSCSRVFLDLLSLWIKESSFNRD